MSRRSSPEGYTANVTKAQAPQVVPYPFIEEGQALTISESSPHWDFLIDASTLSRAAAQARIDNALPPSDIWTCNDVVCCQTVWVSCAVHPGGHFLTTCVMIATGEQLDFVQ